MDLMGQLPRMSKEDVLAFVRSCQHPSGGFSPAPHHDPHLLYTLSAIQVRSHVSNMCHMACHTSQMWSHDLPHLPHVVTWPATPPDVVT